MKSVSVKKAPKFEPVERAEMALIGDGQNITLTRIYAQPGAIFPDHSHPNEQVGTCIEGEGVLTSGGDSLKVKPGITWTIPTGEVHAFIAEGDKPVVIYEAWSPPREDYRKLAGLTE
jgi:quercetin dioxygenase-like cupin family protein